MSPDPCLLFGTLSSSSYSSHTRRLLRTSHPQATEPQHLLLQHLPRSGACYSTPASTLLPQCPVTGQNHNELSPQPPQAALLSRRQNVTNAVGTWRKGNEHFRTSGGNVNCSAITGDSVRFLKNPKPDLPRGRHSLLWHPKGMKAAGQLSLATRGYCSALHNNHDTESS